MRLRLGLLRDTAAIERQASREAAEAEARRHQSKVPTAKTEEQSKAEEAATAKAKKEAIETAKAKPLPRIRPLSEAKAIDSGANFISETFLFLVAGGLIVFESWRSRRKENTRREDVQDRLIELEQSEKAARRGLVALEKELLELKSQQSKHPVKNIKRVLPREVWEVEEKEEEDENKTQVQSWFSQIRSLFPSDKTNEQSPPDNTSSANQPTSESSSSPATSSPHSIIPAVLIGHKSEPSPKEA
jgi:myosin-1